MSLKSIFKKLQIEAAAFDLLPMPPSVQDEMKRQGWTFKTEFPPGQMLHPFANPVAITTTFSPEGKMMVDDEETYARYRAARRAAAEKVYAPS